MGEHNLTLNNRGFMELSGIRNVSIFDEQEVVLETVLGFLHIKGRDLHITLLSLEEGKVALSGTVTMLEYKEEGTDIKTKSKNILTRLLK